MKALKSQQWKCTDEVGYWVNAALHSAADEGNHHSQWMGIIVHWSTNRWCYSSGIQLLELAYHSRPIPSLRLLCLQKLEHGYLMLCETLFRDIAPINLLYPFL